MPATDYDALTAGQQVTATATWPDHTTVTLTGVIATINPATLTTGDRVWSPADLPGATVTYDATDLQPVDGAVILDETGTAWQMRDGTLHGIGQTPCDWDQFTSAHPDWTPLTAIPPAPLPDTPPPGYPVTITGNDTRLGMDIRVTQSTGTTTRTVRGTCCWNQQDPPADDDTPSWLLTSAPTRDWYYYDPIRPGATLTIEQMGPCDAANVWDVAVPEPEPGSVLIGFDGLAWQRITDATDEDTSPWTTPGQGRWTSVLGDQPRSWLWLWGAAAPFTMQEAAT